MVSATTSMARSINASSFVKNAPDDYRVRDECKKKLFFFFFTTNIGYSEARKCVCSKPDEQVPHHRTMTSLPSLSQVQTSAGWVSSWNPGTYMDCY
jgi:hypothetical protein